METEDNIVELLQYLKNKKGYTNEKDKEYIQKIKKTNNNNINILNTTNELGQTPLLLALRYEKNNIANSLIEKGANVNLADNDGDTPILWAAIKNEVVIANQLINKGANVNVKDSTGLTPLESSRSSEMTVLLLTNIQEQENINKTNTNNIKSNGMFGKNTKTALAAAVTIAGLGGLITALSFLGGNKTKKRVMEVIKKE